MEVIVNDHTYSIEPNQNMLQLMQRMDMDQTRGIAAALNGKVIPKTQWQDLVLNHQDKIIIIKATQGG